MTWEIPEVYIIFCFFAIDPWDLGKLFSTICLQQTAGGISKRSAVPNWICKTEMRLSVKWVSQPTANRSNCLYCSYILAKFLQRNWTDKFWGNIFYSTSRFFFSPMRRVKLSLLLLCRKWINDWNSVVWACVGENFLCICQYCRISSNEANKYFAIRCKLLRRKICIGADSIGLKIGPRNLYPAIAGSFFFYTLLFIGGSVFHLSNRSTTTKVATLRTSIKLAMLLLMTHPLFSNLGRVGIHFNNHLTCHNVQCLENEQLYA